MWTDRYTVYYSTEKRYAVRWLDYGRPEHEAKFEKFDDKVEAERFYNRMMADQRDNPTSRVELFFTQAKWLCYQANQDEFGHPVMQSIGESRLCQSGKHTTCAADEDAAVCTCLCHVPMPPTLIDKIIDEVAN